MPRIRTIKPEFASDKKLASTSREARLAFVLLFTQADDDGLVPGRVRQLLGGLYPHDDDVTPPMIREWLSELAAIGAVRWRETMDGAPVIEICNWEKHQRIDHRSKSLVLPHLRPVSRDTREEVTNPSRMSRAPTVDLGPTTVDLGPPTVDQRPPVAAHVRAAIAKDANDALDHAFGTTDGRRILLPSTATAVLEVMAADSIPLEFALAAIRAAVPTLKKPPRSLAYFAPVVRERWELDQLAVTPRRAADDPPRPSPSTGRIARNHAALARGLALLENREVAARG